MQWFDKKVKKPIDLFSHPVWFVLRDEDIDCPCLDPVSRQPDPACRICLGTGRKISLARVKAAHQNNKISIRGTGMGYGEIDIVNVYYTHAKTSIRNGDIVVDGEDVDIVKDVYYEHSDEQKTVYWRIETTPYRKNREGFKKLLASILEEAGYGG